MLDVNAEQQHLNAALATAVAQGRAVLEWLPEASWHRLHERLVDDRWHVLHFIGHGDYDHNADQGRVALVGEDGRADWVDAERLADLLDQAEPTPRLVVLNSCSSGEGGIRDLFPGTAAALVHSGISAVVAMQFRVSDRAAVDFPRGFYRQLVAKGSVDEAVRGGRMSILGAPHSLEWVTPVLYLSGEAQLFIRPMFPRPPGSPTDDAGTQRLPDPPDASDHPLYLEAFRSV